MRREGFCSSCGQPAPPEGFGKGRQRWEYSICQTCRERRRAARQANLAGRVKNPEFAKKIVETLQARRDRQRNALEETESRLTEAQAWLEEAERNPVPEAAIDAMRLSRIAVSRLARVTRATLAENPNNLELREIVAAVERFA